MKRDGKLIFSPQVAKFLLHRGCKIIDLKPNKNDRKQSVFIFEYSDDLNNALADYKNSKPV